MPRILVQIEYDGSNYHGWQVQPNEKTIQAEIENALHTCLREKLRLKGVSRTDSGVHARAQIAYFDINFNVDLFTLQKSINALTPLAINISHIYEVKSDFNPRAENSGKRYIYQIWHSTDPSPFYHKYSWQIRSQLDLGKMLKAAKMISSLQDFAAFRAPNCQFLNTKKKFNRLDLNIFANIGTSAQYQQSNDELLKCKFIQPQAGVMIQIVLEADSFLKQMARIIVGTIVQIGLSKLECDRIDLAAESAKRSLLGPTAPAKGLFLDKIFLNDFLKP